MEVCKKCGRPITQRQGKVVDKMGSKLLAVSHWRCPVIPALGKRLAAPLLLLLALTATAQHTATVQQRDGLDVYILSTPTAPHDYLGSVRYLGNFLPGYIGRPQHHVAKLVRRAKRKFPDAQGIVVGESDMTRATVIVYQKPPAP